MQFDLYRMRTTSGRILYLWEASPSKARAVVRRLLNPEDGYIVSCGKRELRTVPKLRKVAA